MQVCDKDSNEDAHSFKHEAGDLYDLIPSRTMAAKPALEWNQVEIVSNNQRLDLYLNEVHIISSGLWDETWKKLIAASKFKDMPGFGVFHSGHIGFTGSRGGSMVPEYQDKKNRGTGIVTSIQKKQIRLSRFPRFLFLLLYPS